MEKLALYMFGEQIRIDKIDKLCFEVVDNELIARYKFYNKDVVAKWDSIKKHWN